MCADNDGLFVSLDKISPDPFPTSAQQPARPKPTNGKQSYVSAATASGPAGSTRSKTSPTVKQEHNADPPKLGPCQFKKNERVMVFDKRGKEVFGKVRWFGERTKSKHLGFMAVGIETVSCIVFNSLSLW